jgi:flagellar motor switch protein FliN/FliY
MSSSENVFGVGNYYRIWSEAVSSTLSQLSGKTLSIEVGPPVDDSADDRLWVTFTFGELLLGEQALSASKTDALVLAQLLMGETPNPEAEFTADHADAFAELFRQFAGIVAVNLKGELGTEIGVCFKDTNVPAWASAESSHFSVTTDTQVGIALRMDTGLLNSLNTVKPVEAEEPQPATEQSVGDEPGEQEVAEPEVEQPAMAAVAEEETNSQTKINDKNLDLLLDLELEVSVRFGRREMMLKDVLELSSGAMVELDRRVRDPIELVLGGKVIAKGEAVIVDGNYGIRITEIMSRRQRLEQIA